MAETWFLFFPAVGYANDGQVNNIGANGNYWSASLGSKNVNNAYKLNFNSGNCEVNNNNRYYGYAVRPVFSQHLFPPFVFLCYGLYYIKKPIAS